MDDGSEDEFGPNQVMLLPPGHDAWTVGGEPCVFVEFDSAQGDPPKPLPDSRPRPVHRALGQHPVGTAEHHPPAADMSGAGAAPAPWSWPVVGLTVPADWLRASPEGVGAHRWLLRTPACGCA